MTTLDSLDEARAMAGMLVERKLAACVQITKIESVYEWQGAVRNDDEFRLMAKTTAERYPDVEAAILEQHPYDLPAVFALDVSFAHAPYADWVTESSCAAIRPG